MTTSTMSTTTTIHRSMFSVLLLVFIFLSDAFHGSEVTGRQLFFHKKFLGLCATTETSAAAIEQITNKIVAGMNAKVAEGKANANMANMLAGFFEDYKASSIQANDTPENYQQNAMSFVKLIQQSIESPHKFEAHHIAIREPFDYYKWGMEFLRPLIVMEQSRVVGIENARKIEEYVARGDNVFILSNHQTEADPQVLSILLQREGIEPLAEKMIFIAGHKVTNDPVAMPFSMGRNLICIHSKKHIRNPPEEFEMKQAQNLASMKVLGDLATAGGRVFWVAPSGGRDRPDATGKFVVSPLDGKSLDMFRIIAMSSKRPMHFFPMAMYTNNLVPPPADVSSTLGEQRSAKRGPVSVHFLPETDGLGSLKDKVFAAELEASIVAAYAGLVEWHEQNTHL